MTRHLNADLPPELIARWRADRAAGLSLQRIALRDGVSDWTVHPDHPRYRELKAAVDEMEAALNAESEATP